MKILINNNTDISNQYLRFIKWEIYKLIEKYRDLMHYEIFTNKEGSQREKYQSVIKLGISGNFIIYNKQESLKQLCKVSLKDLERHLRGWKNKKVQRQFINNP